MPSSHRWFSLDPFSTSSAAGGSEESRAFLQERVAFVSRIAAGLVLLTYVLLNAALSLRGEHPLRAWLDTYGILHLATAGVLGAVWLLCRIRPLSCEALGALDLVGSVVACTAASVMLAFPEATADHKFRTLLGVSNGLIGRAAAIPSPAHWTFAVSLAATIPTVVLVYAFHALRGDDPPLALAETASGALWCLTAVAVATLVSRIIYGLRRAVHEARRLGQYTLEEKIAEGGMGVVYRARHALLRRPTAIKLLPPEKAGATSLKRFEREVQLTSILTHPNTVAVYDYGHTPDGVFYYAMEFLDGVNLQDLVREEGRQPPNRVVHILRQMCGALAEAHSIGLIHRDVKPANVILCERGGIPDVAKVLDFGLVRDLQTAGEVGLTGEVAIAGTPLYLSPEAINAPERVDARSDLYAVGAVGYYLLTGHPVFEARTIVEICGHHLHTVPRRFAEHGGPLSIPGSRPAYSDASRRTRSGDPGRRVSWASAWPRAPARDGPTPTAAPGGRSGGGNARRGAGRRIRRGRSRWP